MLRSTKGNPHSGLISELHQLGSGGQIAEPNWRHFHNPSSVLSCFLSFNWPRLKGCRNQGSQPRIQPWPLQWKCSILTTEPQGKFPRFPLSFVPCCCSTAALLSPSSVSLSLSHTPKPPSTHTCHKSVSGKVSHLHRTLVHPSVCLSNSLQWRLHTRKPPPRPSQPHPPTPVTLTSFLWSWHCGTFPSMSTPVPCHWESCPIYLAALPGSFHLGNFMGISVAASGFCGQNCPEERKDLALSPGPHSPCTGLLSRLQTGLPLNAWVVWVLRCLH